MVVAGKDKFEDFYSAGLSERRSAGGSSGRAMGSLKISCNTGEFQDNRYGYANKIDLRRGQRGILKLAGRA
jgi:hypothetical protein